MYDTLTIVEHPVIQHNLTVLRDANTAEEEFRRRLENICQLLVYEMTANLPLREVEIETPLETMPASKLDTRLVVVSILRAGLGMQEPLVRMLPGAAYGHLGYYRNEETLEPVQYYAKVPKNLSEATVILADPMLATGGSFNAGLNWLKEHGAKKIIGCVLVAAPEGVEFVAKNHSEVKIYTAALDRELNDKGYILPGLGDAGDRQFATE